jgi:hypothetical protein
MPFDKLRVLLLSFFKKSTDFNLLRVFTLSESRFIGTSRILPFDKLRVLRLAFLQEKAPIYNLLRVFTLSESRFIGTSRSVGREGFEPPKTEVG